MEGRRSDLSFVVGTDSKTEKSLLVGRKNGVQTKIGDIQCHLGIVGDRLQVRLRDGGLTSVGIDAINLDDSVGVILFDGADEIRNDLALVNPVVSRTPSRSLPHSESPEVEGQPRRL